MNNNFLKKIMQDYICENSYKKSILKKNKFNLYKILKKSQINHNLIKT
jgi:hypothetical protein